MVVLLARGVAPGARRSAGAVWFFVCAAAAVLALGAAALAAILRRRIPAEAIGGAAGMTGIRVEGPSWLPLLWLLGLAALAAAVALGVRLLRARRREGGCEE